MHRQIDAMTTLTTDDAGTVFGQSIKDFYKTGDSLIVIHIGGM